MRQLLTLSVIQESLYFINEYMLNGTRLEPFNKLWKPHFPVYPVNNNLHLISPEVFYFYMDYVHDIKKKKLVTETIRVI